MHSPQGLQSLQPIPFQCSTLMPSLCVNKHTFFIHHKASYLHPAHSLEGLVLESNSLLGLSPHENI